MFEYLAIFFAGVIAHWFGVRVLKLMIFSKALAAVVLVALKTLKVVETSLTEAHDVVILQLRSAKATEEDIRNYKAISEHQLNVWRETAANSLSVLLSTHGHKWAEWKDWKSAMKFMKSIDKTEK